MNPNQPTANQPEPIEPDTPIRPDTTQQYTPRPVVAPSPVESSTPAVKPTPTPASVAVAEPASAPVVTDQPAGPDGLPPKPKRSKKKLAVLIGVPVLVLLVAGSVFGLYLPNTPGNVWKTGLNRTGKALDMVVMDATEAKKLEAYNKSEITGDFSADLEGAKITGDISAKFDEKNSNSSLNVSFAPESEAAKTLSAKLLTELPDDKAFPNIYVQLSGLDNLGLGAFIDTSKIQDRWISISSEYLESIGSPLAEADGDKQEQLTAADVAELTRTASSVSRDYLFNADKDKAVFEQKDYVGKETVDGVSVYHYKINYNVNNSIAYCKALISAELSTKAFKKLSGVDDKAIAEQKKDANKTCEKEVKKALKDDKKFQDDLWIDAKYKLIYKLRMHDASNTKNYFDIGQRYKGGDELTFFGEIVETESKGDIDFTLVANTKTNTTKLSVTGEFESGKSKFKLNMTAKPSTGNVNVVAPTDAIPLQQLLDELSNDSQMTF